MDHMDDWMVTSCGADLYVATSLPTPVPAALYTGLTVSSAVMTRVDGLNLHNPEAQRTCNEQLLESRPGIIPHEPPRHCSEQQVHKDSRYFPSIIVSLATVLVAA